MIVIFDLDGTLLNTLADITAAVNYALKKHDFPIKTEREILPCLGHGTDYLLKNALPLSMQTVATAACLRQDYQAYYNTHLTDYTKPYDGILELLEHLQAQSVKLAVASNKYHYAVTEIVKTCFPSIEFTIVLGQQNGAPAKPNPFIIDQILHACGETKENCLYVGDSDVDIQTARNGGVKSCAVTWGFKSRAILETQHPDFWASSPSDIEKLLVLRR